MLRIALTIYPPFIAPCVCAALAEARSLWELFSSVVVNSRSSIVIQQRVRRTAEEQAVAKWLKRNLIWYLLSYRRLWTTGIVYLFVCLFVLFICCLSVCLFETNNSWFFCSFYVRFCLVFRFVFAHILILLFKTNNSCCFLFCLLLFLFCCFFDSFFAHTLIPQFICLNI